MDPIHFSKITRKYVELPVAARLADEEPTDITGVDVALLQQRATPDAATTWTAAEQVPGYALVRQGGGTVSTHDTFDDAFTAWKSGQPECSIVTRWKILIAGPAADPTDALQLDADGQDLWARCVDVPETDAGRACTISVS